MTRWSFEIRLNMAPSDEDIDALFEGGLDDCSIAGDLIYCNREAAGLLGAVASVSADILARQAIALDQRPSLGRLNAVMGQAPDLRNWLRDTPVDLAFRDRTIPESS